ncbi:MAG: phosphoribosyltransferase, partial [Chloroflexota bacterium]
MPLPYRDRRDAGRQLASHLQSLRDQPDVLVLGLPRGGVPVAAEVAAALKAPLDVFIVRKLGVPGHEEFAMGAIASGGTRVLDTTTVQGMRIAADAIAAVEASERRALPRRERLYRGTRPLPDLAGKTVVVVDDGLPPGASMRAAVE